MNPETDPKALVDLADRVMALHDDVKAEDYRAGQLLDDVIARLLRRAAQNWLSELRKKRTPGSSPGGVGAALDGPVVPDTGVGFPQAQTIEKGE